MIILRAKEEGIGDYVTGANRIAALINNAPDGQFRFVVVDGNVKRALLSDDPRLEGQRIPVEGVRTHGVTYVEVGEGGLCTAVVEPVVPVDEGLSNKRTSKMKHIRSFNDSSFGTF